MIEKYSDEWYMNRCIQLARNAEGHTYPNPLVGSVIVHEGIIIGEGFHQKAGEAHAEVNAIDSVSDKQLLTQSTLYVNLEPCAHFGKTPPCSKLIIEKKIPRVVIGCLDSFSAVAGKGIEMLRNAGIEVTVGVLEQESRELNRRFFTYHEQRRPYVILKWAQTLDGFIDKADREKGNPTWITNDFARRAVHKLRTQEQAIMVGTHTALNDNPSLTVREWYGNQPLRIVIDKELRLPKELKLFDQNYPTLVVTYQDKEALSNLEFLKVDSNKDLVDQLLEHLYKINIQSIIIEGGAKLLNSVIKANIWDEAHVYIGNCWFYDGVKAPLIKGEIINVNEFDDSKLFVYRNKSLI